MCRGQGGKKSNFFISMGIPQGSGVGQLLFSTLSCPTDGVGVDVLQPAAKSMPMMCLFSGNIL